MSICQSFNKWYSGIGVVNSRGDLHVEGNSIVLFSSLEKLNDFTLSYLMDYSLMTSVTDTSLINDCFSISANFVINYGDYIDGHGHVGCPEYFEVFNDLENGILKNYVFANFPSDLLYAFHSVKLTANCSLDFNPILKALNG